MWRYLEKLGHTGLLMMVVLFAGGNGSAPDVPICDVQGSGVASPYAGELVRVRGVVTLDQDTAASRGFFLQQAGCDGDASTSDGIFVYLGSAQDVVMVGQDVRVEGVVVEYLGLTELSASSADVDVLGVGGLPAPVEYSPPWGEGASAQYSESLEAMRIAIDAAVVIGPTSNQEETFVLDASLGVTRLFPGWPTGARVILAGTGPYAVTPGAAVGEQLTGVEGVLVEDAGEFQVLLTGAVEVQPAAAHERPSRLGIESVWLASANLHNLFDTIDDPSVQDTVQTPAEYQTHLEKLARMIASDLQEPPLIAVQEVEHGGVLQSLANRPEINVQYEFIWQDGPDARGLDVALFYDPLRVTVLSYAVRQGCTSLTDGFGPDGNLDPLNPQNALTCDLDGLPGNDGNRLFSRPPLMVEVELCAASCLSGGPPLHFWLIIVHLKSKTQDTEQVAYTLPRRLAQANFLLQLVEELQSADPDTGVVLAGDFNDTLSSAPLDLLTGYGLVDLMAGLSLEGRYTYNYRGVSQVLDHVLINQVLIPSPLDMLAAVPVPVGSDFPAYLAGVPSTSLRASDHDPVVLVSQSFDQSHYLPVMMRSR